MWICRNAELSFLQPTRGFTGLFHIASLAFFSKGGIFGARRTPPANMVILAGIHQGARNENGEGTNQRQLAVRTRAYIRHRNTPGRCARTARAPSRSPYWSAIPEKPLGQAGRHKKKKKKKKPAFLRFFFFWAFKAMRITQRRRFSMLRRRLALAALTNGLNWFLKSGDGNLGFLCPKWQ